MANDIKIKTIRWFITSHPLLASVLLTNGLMDSHLCWFKTSIDGCPFFLRFFKGQYNLVKMYRLKNGDDLRVNKVVKYI